MPYADGETRRAVQRAAQRRRRARFTAEQAAAEREANAARNRETRRAAGARPRGGQRHPSPEAAAAHYRTGRTAAVKACEHGCYQLAWLPWRRLISRGVADSAELVRVMLAELEALSAEQVAALAALSERDRRALARLADDRREAKRGR